MSVEQPSDHGLQALPPSKDLFGYYRSRFDQFEKERDEFMVLLERCRPSTEEYYDMKREVRQMEEENRQMRFIVSETKKEMGDLRDMMLRLRAENDELKISELEDRKRIRTLIETAGSGDGEDGERVTVFTDEKPTLIRGGVAPAGGPTVVVPPPGRSHGRGAEEQFRLGQVNLDRYMKPRPQPKPKSKGKPGAGTGTGVDTAATHANAANESLLLQVGSLRAHVEDQQRLHEQRIAELMEDRASLMRTMDVRAKRDADRLAQYEERAVKLEKLLHNMTRDYCQLRHHYHGMERKLVEEVEALRAQQGTAMQEAERNRQRVTHMGKKLSKEKEKDVERLRSVMQRQVDAAEHRAATLQNQLTAVERDYDEDARRLRERVRILDSRCKRIDSWRKRDGEGYRSEIGQLHRDLEVMEKELVGAVETEEGRKTDLEALQDCITSSKQAQRLTRDLRKVREYLKVIDKETFGLV